MRAPPPDAPLRYRNAIASLVSAVAENAAELGYAADDDRQPLLPRQSASKCRIE